MSAVTSTGVIPKYIYNYSDALHVETRMTVGFQAVCRKCDFAGLWRSRRITAMDDWQDHKRNHHGAE